MIKSGSNDFPDWGRVSEAGRVGPDRRSFWACQCLIRLKILLLISLRQ